MLTIYLWSLLLIEFAGAQPLTVLAANRYLSRMVTLYQVGEYELNSVDDLSKAYLVGNLIQDVGKYIISVYQMERTNTPKKNKKTKFPLLFPNHKVFVDPFGNRITFSLGFSVNFQAALN